MAKPVRVGVIGTSWWLDMAHLPVLKADPRVELTAICGRDHDRAQEVARKYEIPMVFTDYRELIARGGLDALVVGAPDDQHYTMTMAALDADLHVLCEKPLALNAADARAMYERAEDRGVCHMTFFTWRWMPHYRYMHELIAQGRIGRIYDCQFTFLMNFGLSGQYGWRYDPARANGVASDLGAHMFDLAHYLVGDIARVSAHLAAHIRRPGADGLPAESANDSAMVTLEFAGGAHGVAHLSNVTHVSDGFFEQRVALFGDAGALIAGLKMTSGPPELQLAVGDEPLRQLPIPERFLDGIDITQPFDSQFLSMFSRQPIGCRLFIDAIRAGQVAAPSFYEGWRVQRVIDATLAADAGGSWVSL